MSLLGALANVDTSLTALENAAQILQGQIKQVGEEQTLKAEKENG